MRPHAKYIGLCGLQKQMKNKQNLSKRENGTIYGKANKDMHAFRGQDVGACVNTWEWHNEGLFDPIFN